MAVKIKKITPDSASKGATKTTTPTASKEEKKSGGVTITNKNPSQVTVTSTPSAGVLGGGNDIGFFQRVGNALSGALKSSAADYANVGATAYQGGQAGRTARNQELLEEYQYSLSREQKKLNDLIAANKRDPKTFTASDIESQQYIVDDWQRKVDALGGVVTNKVQEKATQEAYKAVDTLQESAQKDIATAKQGLGKVGQFVVDVGVGGTQLAGDIGAAMLLGGSTTLPMAARVFGSGAGEARRSGATYGQQVAYGAGSALVATLTEKIANVSAPFKKFGKGFLDDALAKVAAKPMGKLVVSALSEGGEEMIENALQPLLQKITYNPDAAYDAEWLAETLYSGAIGAALGGVGALADASTYKPTAKQAETNPLTPATGNTPEATTDAPEINAPQIAENGPQTMPIEEVKKPAVEAPQPATAPQVGDIARPDVPQQQGELNLTLNDGVGAANGPFFEAQKTDFDRLVDEAEEFYPVGANPAPGRHISTPTKDFEGRTINRFSNNALGAAALSDETVATIERLTAEGVMSHDVLSNTQNLAEAEAEINQLKVDGAMEKLRGAASRGETSPRLVAMMEVMLVDASARNDQDMAAELIEIGARLSESSARAMQMFAYLRKFAPEYQLKGIERQVEQMNEDIKARKPKSKKKAAKEAESRTETQKEAQETHEAVNEARKSAAKEIGKKFSSAKYSRKGSKGGKGKVVIEGNQAGEPFVFEYAQKVGEAIANKVSNRTPPKQKTFLEQIASQINRFAKEKLPPTQKQKSLTPTELLRDYMQNADFYNQAWENAQVELRNRGVEDPALDEFMNTGINMDVDGNPKNTIFMQALVHAATQSGETRSMIEKQSALGVTNIAENIANKLIADTGATGEYAFTIQKAAESYVNDVLRSGELDQSKFVDSAVNSAMREIGQTFSALATQGASVKQGAKKQIVDVLSKKYGIGAADAAGIADIAGEAFDKISREKARKALESRFKERKPPVKKSVEQLFEEYANLGAFDADSPFNEQATQKVFGLDKDADYTITISQDLKNEFLAAKNDAERGEVIKKMQKSIAEQTPSTIMDLFTAWRYTNMLGTLRGPAKNVIGNASMRLLGEVNNAIVTGIEKLAMGKVGRTRSLYVGNAYMDAGKADFDAHKSQILGDAKYSETGSNLTDFQRGVREQRRIMQMPGTWGKGDDASALSRNVRKVVDTSLLLEEGRRQAADWMLNNRFFGDTSFARNAYARFLGGYLKANGITAKQFADESWRKSNPEMVEKARNFAANEAQELTFRDNNKIAKWAAKVGRRKDTPWFARMVSEGVAPFRKTLVNIAIRGEQYSPLGYVNAMVEGIQKARGKDVTGNDIVNSLSKATSGTMLLLLGMFMRRNGILRAKEDDEEQAAFDDLVGKQDYSISIPGGPNFTVDWMAPTSMPLFMGAALADVFDGSGLTLDDMTDVFFAIADPLIELSMMQGIQDTLDEVQYSDNRLLQLGVNAALGYLTQGLTSTLLGQLERTTQENRQSTYVDKNSGIPDWLQRKAGAASAKIPGWDYHQIDYVDAWGRVEKNIENPFLRGVYELTSPAYIDKEEMGDLEQELQRLYDAGVKGVFPSRAAKTLEFSMGEDDKRQEVTIDLSADQYVRYAKAAGQKNFRYASQAKKTKEYKSMSDEARGDFIREMYDVAEFEAGKLIHKRYKENTPAMQNYAKAKAEGISPEQYYIFKEGANAAHGDTRQQQIIDVINSMNISGKQKEYLILTKYSKAGYDIAKDQGWT